MTYSKIATGTNRKNLITLKKFPSIFVERFKLDEHDKIEKFAELINDKLDGFDILQQCWNYY